MFASLFPGVKKKQYSRVYFQEREEVARLFSRCLECAKYHTYHTVSKSVLQTHGTKCTIHPVLNRLRGMSCAKQLAFNNTVIYSFATIEKENNLRGSGL
jgi:hypothetical protein